MEGRDIFAVAIQVLLFAVLVTAATSDLLHRKVYNWTTYPAIAFGLALGFAADGMPGLESHFLGLLVGLTVFGLAWLGGMVGPGDMKLMAAVGAIQGIHFIVPAMWYSSLFGCTFAVGYLVYHRSLLRGLARSWKVLVGVSVPELDEKDPLKNRQQYAVPIAFGTMLAWALEVLLAPAGRIVQ
jgi:prepilin peptidase CpaA